MVEFRKAGDNDGRRVYKTADGRYRAMYHARETTGGKRSVGARARGREAAGEWVVTDRSGDIARVVGSGVSLDLALRDFTKRTGLAVRLVRSPARRSR